MNRPIAISGVWCRVFKGHFEILVEVDGTWKLIQDHVFDGDPTNGPVSHITETAGIETAVDDPLKMRRP